jgi:hypothetical protein
MTSGAGLLASKVNLRQIFAKTEADITEDELGNCPVPLRNVSDEHPESNTGISEPASHGVFPTIIPPRIINVGPRFSRNRLGGPRCPKVLLIWFIRVSTEFAGVICRGNMQW